MQLHPWPALLFPLLSSCPCSLLSSTPSTLASPLWASEKERNKQRAACHQAARPTVFPASTASSGAAAPGSVTDAVTSTPALTCLKLFVSEHNLWFHISGYGGPPVNSNIVGTATVKWHICKQSESCCSDRVSYTKNEHNGTPGVGGKYPDVSLG